MTDRVEARTLEPQAVLCIRASTVPGEIAGTLAAILAELDGYLHASKIEAAGSPFARYYVYEADRVEMDAGIPVPGTAMGTDRMRIGQLPGGEAVVATHIGSHNSMRRAYRAIDSWLEENGRKAAGAPWEVYVTDSAEQPDSTQWRTDVYQPLE